MSNLRLLTDSAATLVYETLLLIYNHSLVLKFINSIKLDGTKLFLSFYCGLYDKVVLEKK